MTVGAFALVLTMDLNRRDNDRKVLAVKVQMQELMAALFEYVINPLLVRVDGVNSELHHYSGCAVYRILTMLVRMA